MEVLVTEVHGGLAAFLSWTEPGRHAIFGAFFPLYTRLKKEEVLDHFVRGQVFGVIKTEPGTHFTEIRDNLGLSNGTLSYHLRTLEVAGFIRSEREGMYKRFFAADAQSDRGGEGIRLSTLQKSLVEILPRKEEAEKLSRHAWLALLIILSMFASIFLVHPVAQDASAQAAPFVVNVGVQDEMKTRNLIRGFFFGGDVWTADALNPVGEGSVQTDPETQTVLPYTMVGTDVNGDGKLQATEVGVFSNVQVAGRSSEWIAVFNIKGVRWHDGTQVEREDVLFGYHLASLAPAVTSSRFVKDKAGQAGSNYSSTRYQNINPVAIAGASTDGWLGGPVP